MGAGCTPATMPAPHVGTDTVLLMGNGARWTTATRQGRALWANRAAVRRLAARHGIVDVVVFGSVARADASEDSDIDLLVQFGPGDTDPDVLVPLERQLGDLLGFDVDLACELTMNASVLRQARRDARTL